MIDFLLFISLFIFLILQRVVELFIAKRNEKWMKQQGAVEFGEKHYKYMVILHVLFFAALYCEKVLLNRGLSPVWPLLTIVFIISQLIRIWAISSLGKYWNTKIIVLENVQVVRKGPYRFLKHPNYLVVVIELLVVPLLFDAFYTACLFSLLNVILLMIRIPEEEQALRTLTEYASVFQEYHRFIPKIMK